MRVRSRYEVQVFLPGRGWYSAGNWACRTFSEARRSLIDCARGADGKGSIHPHRLVRLDPIVLLTRQPTRPKGVA